MNLNNNNNKHKIDSLMNTSNKFHALFMGMLLIATTFSLMTSNTIATAAFVQQPVDQIKVTISKLPKQTDDASTEVTLSNNGPNNYHGEAVINIPGIGNGQVGVDYHINPVYMRVILTNIPGQTDPLINNIPLPKLPMDIPIDIPGIGSGFLTLN